MVRYQINNLPIIDVNELFLRSQLEIQQFFQLFTYTFYILMLCKISEPKCVHYKLTNTVHK